MAMLGSRARRAPPLRFGGNKAVLAGLKARGVPRLPFLARFLTRRGLAAGESAIPLSADLHLKTCSITAMIVCIFDHIL
jgi:hypothetical protein